MGGRREIRQGELLVIDLVRIDEEWYMPGIYQPD